MLVSKSLPNPVIWFAAEHLPKVTLNEVKRSLQRNHKTAGGNPEKKKWGGDSCSSSCDWRRMKGYRLRCDWLKVGHQHSPAEVLSTVSAQRWMLVWINKDRNWRLRNLDKARQQLISKRSIMGISADKYGQCQIKPTWTNSFGCKDKTASERTSLSRVKPWQPREGKHDKHNRHICRCSPVQQMFEKIILYFHLSQSFLKKHMQWETSGENV